MRFIAFEHLIFVPCHAVWNLRGDPLADASWFLRDYQRGEPRFYLEHIRRGVELAAAGPAALLVFSGGQTSFQAGPRSEAAGYWTLAESFDWWGHDVRSRAINEEVSRDSFENVLFSICRFRDFTGAWPHRITAAGWRFKTRRFTERHCAAVRFPANRFHYIGVNDPVDLSAAARDEAQTCAAFALDPYAAGGFLAGKRALRDPFRNQPGFALSCPELRGLLAHRGPEIYSGPLPWDGGPVYSESGQNDPGSSR
jgi:hypothetical protein